MFIVQGKMNVYNVRPPDEISSLKKAMRRTSVLSRDRNSSRDLLLKLGSGELTTQVIFQSQKSMSANNQRGTPKNNVGEENKEKDYTDLQRHDSLREIAKHDPVYRRSEVITNPEFLEEGIPKLEYIGTLSTGQALGQHSMTINKTRQVVVIACEDCHVGYFNKKLFDEFLLKIEQKRIFNLVNFFYDAFNAIVERKIMLDLIFCMKKQKSIINSVLFNEGDLAEKIYIIRKGEVMVSIDLPILILDLY
jgi:CRP-like cAMP-binding protein